MRFLGQHELHEHCFTLHSPHDLNNRRKIQELFSFFDLPPAGPQLNLIGRRNQSIGYRPVVTPADERDCDAVLERMPGKYLEIFHGEPYRRFEWNARLAGGHVQSASDKWNLQ
jgi:hypothetical protein